MTDEEVLARAVGRIVFERDAEIARVRILERQLGEPGYVDTMRDTLNTIAETIGTYGTDPGDVDAFTLIEIHAQALRTKAEAAMRACHDMKTALDLILSWARNDNLDRDPVEALCLQSAHVSADRDFVPRATLDEVGSMLAAVWAFDDTRETLERIYGPEIRAALAAYEGAKR